MNANTEIKVKPLNCDMIFNDTPNRSPFMFKLCESKYINDMHIYSRHIFDLKQTEIVFSFVENLYVTKPDQILGHPSYY